MLRRLQKGLKDRVHLAADFLTYSAFLAVVGLLRLLPYKARVQTGSWLFAHMIAPLAGYRRRIDQNLRLIFPQMPDTRRKTLVSDTARNIGRMVIELLSPADIKRLVAEVPISGPGWAAMQEARKVRRPIILVSGHFGNYDVARAGVIAQGFDVGGIYRPLNNRFFNRYYLRNISMIGEPLFERGRRGMGEMVRFLKAGGTVAVLIDQHMHKGEPLTFMGQVAQTALSAAELALKYDALLVPCYGIRRADGLSFDMIFEEPLPHTTALEMTQALNDSLEVRVRENVDQWLWIHRRWKGKTS